MSAELKRLLLVEDDPAILRIARMALEMLGKFEVRACSSGEAALEAVEAFEAQMALLDVMMPGMDGPMVLAKLRERPATAALPVIFLTAKAKPDEIERLRSLGALEVIAKPFEPAKLIAQVREAWARV